MSYRSPEETVGYVDGSGKVHGLVWKGLGWGGEVRVWYFDQMPGVELPIAFSHFPSQL